MWWWWWWSAIYVLTIIYWLSASRVKQDSSLLLTCYPVIKLDFFHTERLIVSNQLVSQRLSVQHLQLVWPQADCTAHLVGGPPAFRLTVVTVRQKVLADRQVANMVKSARVNQCWWVWVIGKVSVCSRRLDSVAGCILDIVLYKHGCQVLVLFCSQIVSCSNYVTMWGRFVSVSNLWSSGWSLNVSR